MNKKIRCFGFKSLLIAAICLLTFSSIFASTTKEKNYSLVEKNLSQKLRADLANEAVAVKLDNVEEYKISKSEIGLKGNGTCILASENNQLPIRFDVKINMTNHSVSDIVYDFVENVSELAPASSEELLMKELMKKISKDYNTNNIVIAIDGMENVSNSSRQKEFTGIGEVRIGDLVWNKIKFDVVFNVENNAATKVVYKVEK